MLYHISITILVIFLLMAGWIIIQAWERRDSFARSEECDDDVMLKRFNCIGCFFTGHCRKGEEHA